MSQAPVSRVLDNAQEAFPRSIERLQDFLRIRSISTDGAYADECRKAADWLKNELSDLGFKVDIMIPPNDGELTHPIVYAHYPAPQGKPTVLFYGHYDVQPAEPLELWESDPFDPQIVEEEPGFKVVRARGSSDDKGQVMTFVEACRAYHKIHGSLPVGIKILIEGEEESAGAHLPPFIENNKDLLKADVALICDTSMVGRDTPAIATSLRGLVGEEIIVKCADRDLHSGVFGNAAVNPIQVLVDILSELRRKDGSVALEGFYDGIAEPTEEMRKEWAKNFPDPDAFLKEVGLSKAFGEEKYTALEQTWIRPSYEINGIAGGYYGEGIKTVLPAQAVAKVTFRTVPGQKPLQIREAFRRFVTERLPEDAKVEFHEHGASPGFAVSDESAFLAPALEALEAEWDKKALCIGMGGSIPVAEEFKRRLNLDSLLIGFAFDDDRIHSPNERYSLKSFNKGIRSWVRILDAFAAL